MHSFPLYCSRLLLTFLYAPQDISMTDNTDVTECNKLIIVCKLHVRTGVP